MEVKIGVQHSPRELVIDSPKTPEEIAADVSAAMSGGTKDGRPYGQGILKRDNNTVQLMYTWGGARATSFEQPPEGHWLITLQRTR